MTRDLLKLAGQPVIIGAGIAGLMTALRLAPQPVILLSKGRLGAESSSVWAQGGLAASMGTDDSPSLHLDDTLAAGDGLCDREAAARITAAAPAAIEALCRLGVRFDRMPDGALALGLEAAHGRRRIVHAAGDGTGREIVRALAAAARATPSITVLEGFEARRLLVEDGVLRGVLVAGPRGGATLPTNRVVIATGGIGGLFTQTTNPDGSFGQGLALAARAGAQLADLEFIQFHPTALAGPHRPAPLISEAVRGEGALLVDETGDRFLAGEPGAELASRDIVARGVWRRLSAGHATFLDARVKPGAHFAEHFPVITAACRAAGIDPATQLIPIQPAVHYHMGGIAVDASGRSSVPGLWACGEAAATGLHGANRLASNSLLEAVVCAGWVAQSVAGADAGRSVRPREIGLPCASDPSSLRAILSRGLGVLRDGRGLEEMIRMLLPIAHSRGPAADPALTGLIMAVAAWRRQESRGAHWRTDFPMRDAIPRRSVLCLDEALSTARDLSPIDQPLIA
ncbi:L-aspartate oxidase [Methylovirgula sp. 4M-Z18]|uniref:L-aspartate oxidase n=1 Tax=Methylovirgula sp. 4M-Z18 TaxID=2293567 RepID=UPI000E2FDA4F|nr:L-aspartate oxidase [Methylovirgula sp. 4M-Z18]RFB76430.1 L-aspartate oxidase [Methylovirgula sp. 4M-Z18]